MDTGLSINDIFLRDLELNDHDFIFTYNILLKRLRDTKTHIKCITNSTIPSQEVHTNNLRKEFKIKKPQYEGIGIGPAYRYRRTFESAVRVAMDNWIGVVCGIRLVENLEIITWLKKHEGFSRVNFLFLNHPSMQPADRKILLEEMVGSSFSVSDTGFLQALNENSRFVVSSSSSGVIALFQNRQVLRIPTWKCTDINPLEDFEGFYYHSENEDHVRKFLDLNSSLVGTPDTKFSPEFIDSYFNYKINDLNLEISKISTRVTRRP